MSQGLFSLQERSPFAIIPLVTDLGIVGNLAGAETALHTKSIPAKGLEYDGDSISFEYVLSATQVNGNVIKLKFGGTTLLAVTFAGTAPGGGSGCKIRGRLTRVRSNSQLFEATFSSDPLNTGFGTVSNALLVSESIDATAVDLKVTGQGVLADAVQLVAAIMDFRGVVR